MSVTYPAPPESPPYSVEEDLARRNEITIMMDALRLRLMPINDRLKRAGVEPHVHGAGTYESPSTWHTHPHHFITHTHPEEDES